MVLRGLVIALIFATVAAKKSKDPKECEGALCSVSVLPPRARAAPAAPLHARSRSCIACCAPPFAHTVCIKVMQGVLDSIPAKEKKSMGKIESRVSKYCAKKTLDYKEKKVCYLIDPIKRKVSRPMSIGMKADDICARKLKKQNPEICHVKYKIKTDANTDYSKMRVKHLKQILAARGVACVGCMEKRDYVEKVKATAHLEL
jgi:hypothetical protein